MGTTNLRRPGDRGPSVTAIGLWGSSGGKRLDLLTDEKRTRLAGISSVVRYDKGVEIYCEGDCADAVFNIIGGVVKTYKNLDDQTKHIVAFLFPDDLFGLPAEGKYVNSAEAATAVTAYRIPVSVLETGLRRDPELEFLVICKLCQELREAQRHALLLSKRRAPAKIAMFVQMLENYQCARGESLEEVYLPMSRSDIADYVGMSAEAVSRSFRSLANRGAIVFRDRQHLRIVSRSRLDSAAANLEPHELPYRQRAASKRHDRPARGKRSKVRAPPDPLYYPAKKRGGQPEQHRVETDRVG
jgi:CRP/FNR family transcriptional regulator